MPLYEYDCTACGTTFEKLRPMSKASTSAPCAQCGSAETSRAISLFSAISKSSNGGSRSRQRHRQQLCFLRRYQLRHL